MPDAEKHTPGPWEVGITPSDDRRIALVLKGTDMQVKDNVYRDIHTTRHKIEKQEPVANGHLIAAAPDLLAACENMVQAVPPDGEALRASRSAERAVAKARGLGGSDLPDRNERGVSGLTNAGEEVSELRDENERLRGRVADLEAAIKSLSHYDLDAARKAAHSARKQGLAEVADLLDDACDDITRALLGFFDARDAQAEVPHE